MVGSPQVHISANSSQPPHAQYPGMSMFPQQRGGPMNGANNHGAHPGMPGQYGGMGMGQGGFPGMFGGMGGYGMPPQQGGFGGMGGADPAGNKGAPPPGDNNSEARAVQGQVGEYMLGKEICEGSYGVVRQAVRVSEANSPNARVYAIKIIQHARFSETEVILQQRMAHPNVVEVKEAFRINNLVFVVLQLCQGGDVFEFVQQMGRPLDERSAMEYFKQMLATIMILHRNGIVHHDIKLENFLLAGDRRTLRLCDFGAAEEVKPDGMTSRYKGEVSAPEKIEGQMYNGFMADIFQLGKSLHELCFCLRAPKPNAELNPPPGVYPSPALVDLLRMMLQNEPQRRPSIDAVASHQWLSSVTFPDLRLNSEKYAEAQAAAQAQAQAQAKEAQVLAEAQAIAQAQAQAEAQARVAAQQAQQAAAVASAAASVQSASQSSEAPRSGRSSSPVSHHSSGPASRAATPPAIVAVPGPHAHQVSSKSTATWGDKRPAAVETKSQQPPAASVMSPSAPVVQQQQASTRLDLMPQAPTQPPQSSANAPNFESAHRAGDRSKASKSRASVVTSMSGAPSHSQVQYYSLPMPMSARGRANGTSMPSKPAEVKVGKKSATKPPAVLYTYCYA